MQRPPPRTAAAAYVSAKAWRNSEFFWTSQFLSLVAWSKKRPNRTKLPLVLRPPPPPPPPPHKIPFGLLVTDSFSFELRGKLTICVNFRAKLAYASNTKIEVQAPLQVDRRVVLRHRYSLCRRHCECRR